MIRLCVSLFCAALIAACSCESPTSPSVATPPTPPPIAPPVTPTTPAAICSSAKPQGFRVTSGERVAERWKNLFTWPPLEATSQTYIVEWRNWNERAATVHTFTHAGSFVERYDFGDGVFEARVRLACSQAWSDYVTFSNGCWLGCGPQVPPPPTPPPPPPPPRPECVEACQ